MPRAREFACAVSCGCGKLIVVSEFCTCGAQLLPEARFCHKCGRPVREEPRAAEAPEEKPAAQPAPAAATAQEISFRDSTAVRVGFVAGVLAFVLGLLPSPFPVRALLLAAAGGFSVYLYGRRTGRSLTVGGGARIGWISGLFGFVIVMVLFTLNFALIAVLTRDIGMANFYRQQLSAMGMPPQHVEQVLEIFQSPVRLAGLLISIFVMFTGLLMAGGALGAKLLRRNEL
ncbi:MAG: zinc ribbon domain-containing protein [Bryobacterales bacterium]|nr:hypothetical protein [Bryobacteraceae bacterium]MDW8354901.1 zinc ribbon domain-containing protein [Bryobacterales bacterium]